MNLEEFYEQYGQSLATRLVAIGHNQTDKRFVYVDNLDKPAELIKEATTKLPQGVNVLVWEAFSDRTGDGGRDNYHLQLYGSLAVMRKDGTTATAAKAAKRIAREVALKVIALMHADEADGALADQNIRFEFGNDGEPIVLEGGWAGWGYSFQWMVPLDLTLSDDDLIP